MGSCCGGKNAGKPISWPRYLAGLTVFCGYHGAVLGTLAAASLPFPRLRQVRDFHAQVFRNDLREIVAREDINVGAAGRTRWAAFHPDEEACVVDVTPLHGQHAGQTPAGGAAAG